MTALPISAALQLARSTSGGRGARQLEAAVARAKRVSTWNKYYSKVRFQFALTGAGPFVYTCPAGTEQRAFGYSFGQDMSAVGFPAGTNATLADTNLQQAGVTNAGETVLVYGISLQLCETSDPTLAALLWPNLSVALSLNGDQTSFKLGTAAMVPGSGGLHGQGLSLVAAPAIAEPIASRVGSVSNGVPSVSNFYPIPEPVVWAASGSPDSNLIIKLRCERAAAYTTQLAADRAAAAGIMAWTHPAANGPGTFVDCLVSLWSRQVSGRSQNA